MIDFELLEEMARGRALPLLEELLPGGELRGREWVCANIGGGAGESFSFNTDTLAWKDFARDEKGGKGFVSLLAAQGDVSQGAAAKELARTLGVDLPLKDGAKGARETRGAAREKPCVILPVPDDAPQPDMRRRGDGRDPDMVFTYRDRAGRLLGFTRRFNSNERDSKGKLKKEFRPLAFTEQGWREQSFDAPCPLYGLERLPDGFSGRVVITEGEAKADALQSALGPSVAVLSLYGGSQRAGKARCAPLKGRACLYWPDADGAGVKAALAFHEAARAAGAASIAILEPPEGVCAGWDAKDAIEADWSRGRLETFLKDCQRDADAFREIAAARGWLGDAPSSSAGLRCVNIVDFMKMDITPPEMLIDPILRSQGLTMIHAARGTGKTFISLSLAYGLAAGESLLGRWEIARPVRTLFIDGEMPSSTLQERLGMIIRGVGKPVPSPDYLKILTPDLQSGPMPNIANAEGQAAIEPFLEGMEVVILDNLATLARHGRSNDEESWAPVQGWLLELRRRGLSVILIHHSGKNGDQRGTSAREDILDCSIRLDRPQGYQVEEGARFEVAFTKARGCSGEKIRNFEARLDTIDGRLSWTTRDIEDVKLETARRLFAEGMTVRDVAEEMGITKSAAGRLKKKLDAA